jgi:hypothetical protein
MKYHFDYYCIFFVAVYYNIQQNYTNTELIFHGKSTRITLKYLTSYLKKKFIIKILIDLHEIKKDSPSLSFFTAGSSAGGVI